MNNLDKYESSYLGRVGNAFSQLGHSISGGTSDVSISGKIGYMTEIKGSKYWELLKWVVNNTFEPIDGKNHCQNAYTSDKFERYEIGTGVRQAIICTVLVSIFCPIIAIFTWSIKLFKNGFSK